MSIGAVATPPFFFECAAKEELMNFYADHYFQIGHTHYIAGKPCQDHALSRSNGSVVCAIVADGCSTGGSTDIGARILTLSTLQAIRDHANAFLEPLETAPTGIIAKQQQIVRTVRPVLGLEPRDMLATCVYAYFTKQGGFVHVEGDGVVGFRYLNGNTRMHRYDWAGNTPFYPAYDGEDLAAFIAAHGSDLQAERLTSQESLHNSGGELLYGVSARYSLRQGLAGIHLNVSPEEMRELEYVAVFTDGVTQISGIPWQNAVLEFLSFKNTMGEFAKRRMIRGIKDFQKKGFEPLDDIAYAVIGINHGE